MTWKDFFGCEWDEYAQRISRYTTQDLRTQEIVKTRQLMSASCSIGGGIGGAAFTMGGTLAISVYGSRRYRVAHKKLKLIESELLQRGVPLHDMDCKDILIPLAASLVGSGVGIGLDQVAAAATNTIPMGVGMPTGSTAINAVVTNPGDAVQAVVPGFTQQVAEMCDAFQGVSEGIIPGSDLSQLSLAANTSWVTAPNIETAVGFHAGMLMAQTAEKSVTSIISAQCAWSLMEAMTSMDTSYTRHPCTRTVGTAVNCDHCSTTIRSGTYWHCCECDDNYDICNKCYNSSKRCPNQHHTVTRRQVALNADFTARHHEPIYSSWSRKDKQLTRKDLGQIKLFGCDICKSLNSQGTIYHCDCHGGFDVCESCYLSGGTCDDSSHAFISTVCALDCSSNPRAVLDCKRNQRGISSMSCNHCKRGIPQGRYYHCCLCQDDNFDLCHACYKQGARCHNPTQHPLMLHLVGIGMIRKAFSSACTCADRRDIVAQQMKHGTCSICKEAFGKGFLWHCCLCDDGQFDICGSCYGKGQGCNNSTHQMLLCDTSE